jgi:hypothetical protein
MRATTSVRQGADSSEHRAGAAAEGIPQSRTLRRLHCAAPFVIVGLWALTLRHIRLREMSDYGLVSVLPGAVLLLLVALTVSFALLLRRRPVPTFVGLAHVVALIVILYGVTTFIEAEPRFLTTWRHVGIIDSISKSGSVDPHIDAYFNWPGFFAFGGLLAKVAGFHSTLSIAAWGPIVFNLLTIAPLLIVFRWATDDERLVWLGLWVFFSSNWVAQDYFSPQAVAFVLWMAVLAILLSRFTPRATALASGLTPKALARSLAANVRGSPPSHAQADPGSGYRNAAFVLLCVTIYASVVTGHQLTPSVMLATVTALVLLARLQTRQLPVVMLILLVAWLSYMATVYLHGHLETVLKPVGSVGDNLNQSVAARIGGSAKHEFIVHLRVVATGSLWALAVLGAVRRLWNRHLDLALALIATTPLLLPALQPYGGEVLLRVFLFALPAVAFFAACLAFPTRAAGRKWITTVAIAAVGCAMLLMFQYTRYGNERQDYYTTGDVAAVEALYGVAPPGSVVVAGTPNIPWKFRNYADYDYRYAPDLEAWKAGNPDVESLIHDIRTNFDTPHVYVIVTRSTKIAAALYNGRPGLLEQLVTRLDRSPNVDHVYHGRDGDVLRVDTANHD